MVGAHATQVTVSNATWTKGICRVSDCSRDAVSGLVTCLTGLQYGIVQTWPADHHMATQVCTGGY
jgi:hypothetical protein